MATASISPLETAIYARSAGISPEQQKALMAYQNQQSMAQALLADGIKPVDLKDRQIGGVGYAVSPLEGVNKIAQVLAGSIGQNSANQSLMDALQGPQQTLNMHADNPEGAPGSDNDTTPVTSSVPMTAPQQASQGDATSLLPPQLQSWARTASLPEAMGGNPRAFAEVLAKFAGPEATGQQAYDNAIAVQHASRATPNTPYAGIANALAQPQVASPTVNPYAAMPGASPQAQPVPQGNMQQPMGTQPPVTPVQGPEPLPSQGALNAPLPTGPNPAPPSGIQLNGPNPNAPPPEVMAAAQAAMPKGTVQEMPTQGANEPYADFQARLEAAKAGAIAQAGVAPAGAKTNAEDNAKNLADAQKTYNVAETALPRAMQRFNELRQAAPNASSGGGVSEEEPGSTFGDYARNYARTKLGQVTEPQTSLANQKIDQAANQGILSELGPQLQGLKGNKFLEGIASGASGLNPADPPQAKLQAINGLQDQYISNMKALAEQRRQYGDTSAPSDIDMATLISKHADPATKISVIDPQGNLGRVDPQHLIGLIKDGGQLR